MSDSFIIFTAFFYFIVALIVLFGGFFQRHLDKKYGPALSDYKDFKIGDPVVFLYSGGNIAFSYINGVYRDDELGDTFSLEFFDGNAFPSDTLRHPTKEELKQYFRK